MVRIRSWEPATFFRPSAIAARSSLMMPRSLTSQPSRASIAASMKRLESNSCEAARGLPGETSSLPVENTATRRRLRHIDMGQAEGGGERDILRPQPAALLERGMAESDVFAGGAHIGAGFQPCRQHHPAGIIDADIFLHEHGVGAVGHRRAGKDPHRLARLDRFAGRRAGLDATGDLKRLLFALRKVARRAPHSHRRRNW